MAYLLLKNGTVISGGTINRKDILLQDDVILDLNFSGELPPNCEVLDAFGQYIAPGFIEIHSHGAGGADMMDATNESFQTLARTHLAHGTTTLYGTTMTAPFEVVKKVIRTFKTCREVCPNLAGIHSEGIFLSQAQKGAHHENLFHSPTKEETEFILTEGKDIFKRITAAPELPGMLDFSEKMVQNGIQMSIGHSDATSDVAKRLFKRDSLPLPIFIMQLLPGAKSIRPYTGVWWKQGTFVTMSFWKSLEMANMWRRIAVN